MGVDMTEIFNRSAEKEKRRGLRSRMTEAEQLLWEKIRNKQVGGLRFRRQVSIGPYIVDFYCPEKRLAVELDGGYHDDATVHENDAYRTKFLASMGITVMRFTNDEVLVERDKVIAVIQNSPTPTRAARLPLR